MVERKWDPLATASFVKLAIEFDPVKTESVKECGETFHDEEDKEGEGEPEGESNDEADGKHGTGHFEHAEHRHIPQDSG